MRWRGKVPGRRSWGIFQHRNPKFLHVEELSSASSEGPHATESVAARGAGKRCDLETAGQPGSRPCFSWGRKISCFGPG